MQNLILGRRGFLRLGLISSSLLGLSSCGIGFDNQIVRGVKNSLPDQLLKNLPINCEFQQLNISADRNPYDLDSRDKTDYLIIEDGWISELSSALFSELSYERVSDRLSNNSRLFLDGLENKFKRKVFPLGYSPWVMIFLNGEEFISDANESWNILYDKKLKGEIIFPNSPHLLLSIFNHLDSDIDFAKFKSQVKIFDDKNALNWLSSGKAKVAILPLNRCVNSLVRDPRLSVAFPKTGVPLNWTLLLRTKSSNSLFPYEWLEVSWQKSSVIRLISEGFYPPIEYYPIVNSKQLAIGKYKSVFYPNQTTWENCWSLPSLTSLEAKDLVREWNDS